jgi:hypothetical protein
MVLTSNSFAVNASPLIIGAAMIDGIAVDGYAGQIKEFQVWNKTFSDHYIELTNNGKIDLSSNGLVGYYKLIKDKIVSKNGLYDIAVSEFQGSDGIVIHQQMNLSSDKLSKVHNDIDFLSNSLRDFSFIQSVESHNAVSSDLGVKVNETVSNEYFKVNIEKDAGSFYKMDVYSLLGEQIFSSDYFIGEQEQTFGQDLPSGVYMLDVSKGNMVQRLKILKQ